VFENRVLWKLIGHKKAKIMIGDWRQLHDDQLHSLYSWTNIIRKNMSRRIKWSGDGTCMGQNYRDLKMNLNERATRKT
jgi:hypothetical protein